MKKRLTKMPQDERIRPGPYLGYPLWEVYEAFSRTRGL